MECAGCWHRIGADDSGGSSLRGTAQLIAPQPGDKKNTAASARVARTLGPVIHLPPTQQRRMRNDAQRVFGSADTTRKLRTGAVASVALLERLHRHRILGRSA